jgi:hypothetical protein
MKKNDKYKYIGQAYNKKTIKERSNINILRMRYLINKNNNKLPFDEEIEPFIKDNGTKCYKTNCFNKLNLVPTMKNFNGGIMFGHNEPEPKQSIQQLITFLIELDQMNT